MTRQKLTAGSEQQQIVRGMLHVAVLREIEQGKKYGAELLIALSKTPFSSKVGTLYPVLTRLEKSGLLSSEWQISAGQTPRKYYALTGLGRSKLRKNRDFLEIIHTYLRGQT